jgi:tetratricopeptide (TPR) repeat protein
MTRSARRSWLLVAVLVGSTSLAAGKLPCEPSAPCALRLVREAAHKQALSSETEDARERALQAILWTAIEDAISPPDLWRPALVELRSRFDKLPAREREQAYATLARCMAASGLVPEARLLGNTVHSQPDRDAVHLEAARFYARRGRSREAFEVVKMLPANSVARARARSLALSALIDTGSPETVREALQYVDVNEPGLVDSMVPLALQAAGKHEEARAAAMRVGAPRERLALLSRMHEQNEWSGWQSERVATATLLRTEVLAYKPAPDEKELFKGLRVEVSKSLISALLDENQFSEALKLVPELPADDRCDSLKYSLDQFEKPEDVREAAKVLRGLSQDDIEECADGLRIARVRSGEISAERALRDGAESRSLPEGLLQLAYRKGDSQQRLTREVVEAVAVVAKRDDVGLLWASIANAQIEAGLLRDAQSTIDQEMAGNSELVGSLLRLSVAQRNAGQDAESQRTRERALSEAQSWPRGGMYGDRLAHAFFHAGMFDDAERELRQLFGQRLPGSAVKLVALQLTFEHLKAKDLRGAFDLAAAWSEFEGGSPDPFITLYTEITHRRGPDLGYQDLLEVNARPGDREGS